MIERRRGCVMSIVDTDVEHHLAHSVFAVARFAPEFLIVAFMSQPGVSVM